jgi:hypothetical protein
LILQTINYNSNIEFLDYEIQVYTDDSQVIWAFSVPRIQDFSKVTAAKLIDLQFQHEYHELNNLNLTLVTEVNQSSTTAEDQDSAVLPAGTCTLLETTTEATVVGELHSQYGVEDKFTYSTEVTDEFDLMVDYGSGFSAGGSTTEKFSMTNNSTLTDTAGARDVIVD